MSLEIDPRKAAILDRARNFVNGQVALSTRATFGRHDSIDFQDFFALATGSTLPSDRLTYIDVREKAYLINQRAEDLTLTLYADPTKTEADWVDPSTDTSGYTRSLLWLGQPFIRADGSYADPVWITSLAYSKLTGAPTLGTSASHASSDYATAAQGAKADTALQSITSGQVTTALGFTPYNATNPTGYITTSALTGYLTASVAASTYQPLDGDLTAIAALTTTQFGRALLTQADAAAARSTLGAGTSSFSGAFSALSGVPTTLTGYGITDAYPLTGNPSAFLTTITSGQVTTALGFTPYNATNPSSFIAVAGARTAISLTTTGTSGASSYNSTTGILNVPNYANSGGTVTSVTAGTGLSGGTITATGTISMPNVGTASTYTGVTTDAQGRVTTGTALSFSNAPARSIVTTAAAANGWQVSATQNSFVTYSVTITCATQIGIVTNVEGYVVLERAATNSTTASDWRECGRIPNGQNIGLALALAITQKAGGPLFCGVPAGYYVRLRSVNVAGTPTYAYLGGDEVLM